MAIQQRTAWILISVVLIAAGAVYGATKKPYYSEETYTSANLEQPAPATVAVPTLKDIQSIQINLGMPGPGGPRPVYPNSTNNKIISKVLRWLKVAKPVGYETPHFMIMPAYGPTILNISLKDRKQIQLYIALDEVIHRWGDKTVIRSSAAKGCIDYQIGNSGPSLRMYAPNLSAWLLNGWRKDILVDETTKQVSITGSSVPNSNMVGTIETHEGTYIRTYHPLSSFHLPSSAISYYHGSLEKQNEELDSKPGIEAIVRPYGLFIRSNILKKYK